jgi:hypothetical protein
MPRMSSAYVPGCSSTDSITGREHARDMVKGGMGRMLMLDHTGESDDLR